MAEFHFNNYAAYEIHSCKQPDPVKDTFFSPLGRPLTRVSTVLQFYDFSYILTNFRLTTHSQTRRLRVTTQLKWPLPNKRSLIQNTKYLVKALVVGTSCKRTHPHPVNERDHFLRWQSLRIFHDAMVWSLRSLYVLSYSEYERNFRNKLDLSIVYCNLKIACSTFTPKSRCVRTFPR